MSLIRGALALLLALPLAACDEGDEGNVGQGTDPDDGVPAPGDTGPGGDAPPGGDLGPDGPTDAAGGPDGRDAPDAEGAEIGEPVEVAPCISTVRIGDLEVFAYEASRVDADAMSQGFDSSGGLCSRPGVLPWTGMTWPDASRECLAAGFRLCTNEEWQIACGGIERAWHFPYGMAHRPGTCNDHVSGSGAVEPTGDRADCRTPEGAFDMSGNVWELTVDGARRGASFKLNAVMFRTDAARCDMFYDIAEGYADDDVGFRCCR